MKTTPKIITTHINPPFRKFNAAEPNSAKLYAHATIVAIKNTIPIINSNHLFIVYFLQSYYLKRFV